MQSFFQNNRVQLQIFIATVEQNALVFTSV